jgi:hypothetical protein
MLVGWQTDLLLGVSTKTEQQRFITGQTKYHCLPSNLLGLGVRKIVCSMPSNWMRSPPFMLSHHVTGEISASGFTRCSGPAKRNSCCHGDAAFNSAKQE